MTYDHRSSPLERALVGGPVKTEPGTSTNPTVQRVKEFVRGLRDDQDYEARQIRHNLEEGKFREKTIGEANDSIDSAARSVETCDIIERKLDEVDKELP